MKETYPRPRPKRPQDGASADGIIEGRNAVAEALRAGTPIDKVFLLKGEVDLPLRQLANQARQQGAVLAEVDRHKLDAMSRTHAHQGIIAVAAVREYASVEDLLQAARDRGEPPSWWSAMRSPTPTIWGPSSAPPSAPEPTGSSSPSAAAPV